MTGVAGRRCFCAIVAAAQVACSVTIAARCDYVSHGRTERSAGGAIRKILALTSPAP
jgi:hypothetical protein